MYRSTKFTAATKLDLQHCVRKKRGGNSWAEKDNTHDTGQHEASIPLGGSHNNAAYHTPTPKPHITRQHQNPRGSVVRENIGDATQGNTWTRSDAPEMCVSPAGLSTSSYLPLLGRSLMEESTRNTESPSPATEGRDAEHSDERKEKRSREKMKLRKSLPGRKAMRFLK